MKNTPFMPSFSNFFGFEEEEKDFGNAFSFSEQSSTFEIVEASSEGMDELAR
jgi:hypothetical protein